MILASAALLALTTVALVVWRNLSTDLLVRRQLRRQVVVELVSGETFKALLVSCDARSILLRNCVAIISADSTSTVPVDGELIVPRGDVKWIQRP